MKKVIFALCVIVLLLMGCAHKNNNIVFAALMESLQLNVKPAIGFTVVEDVVTEVDIKEQSRIELKARDGMIKVVRWEKDYLQINEQRRLKGPSKKETLYGLLEKGKLKVDTTAFGIKLEKEPDKDLKSLYRRTDDIELMVPASLKSINIFAINGAISISGFDEISVLDLELEKGSIKVKDCTVNKISVDITNGKLDIEGLKGSGRYKCGRADIKIKGVTGDIELTSVSGNTNIEDVEGKLNCDISTGSMTLKKAGLEAEAMLYMTYGDIYIDFEEMSAWDKYIIKAAQGNIHMNLPENTGYSLLAKSTKGHVKDKLGLSADALKKGPSGEVYGDIGVGGPSIDAYVDRGNIYLEKGLDF